MVEYIDLEKAIQGIEEDCSEQGYYSKSDAISLLRAQEVADVASVIRCRDCRFCCAGVMGPWCSLLDGMVVISPDAFCSYGRRKEDTHD